jgi:hypothetical protein
VAAAVGGCAVFGFHGDEAAAFDEGVVESSRYRRAQGFGDDLGQPVAVKLVLVLPQEDVAGSGVGDLGQPVGLVVVSRYLIA